MNVLRSTENMLLFYWEVSTGSRKALLERHRLWVSSKMLLGLPPGACVCDSSSTEFLAPNSRWCCEQFGEAPASLGPMNGVWEPFLPLCVLRLRLEKLKTWIPSQFIPGTNICWFPTVSTSLFNKLSREAGLSMKVGCWVTLGREAGLGMARKRMGTQVW